MALRIPKQPKFGRTTKWQKKPVSKELNKTDKSMPKVNTQDTRHGKLDLPNYQGKEMKKPRKFAEGGWATSVSYDEADAKKRAADWEKSHAASPPAKSSKGNADDKFRAAFKAADEEENSGVRGFMKGFRESNNRPKAEGPKPGSSEYVDRQVADSRAHAAAQKRGKDSLSKVSMLDKSAPDTLRKEVGKAALETAALPAAEGLAALRLARGANDVGYIGRAGTEAMQGLARSSRARNAAQASAKARKAASEYKKAQAGEWTDTYGLGLKCGGKVKAKKFAKGGEVKSDARYDDNEVYDNLPDENKPEMKSKGPTQRYTAAKAKPKAAEAKKFRKGGKVKEANMEKRHVNFMKKAGAPKRMVAEEAAEEARYAKGGCVRGGGCATRGKSFRMR